MSTLLESRIRHDFAGPGPYPTLCPHKPPLLHSHTVRTLVPAPFHLSPLASLPKDAPVIPPIAHPSSPLDTPSASHLASHSPASSVSPQTPPDTPVSFTVSLTMSLPSPPITYPSLPPDTTEASHPLTWPLTHLRRRYCLKRLPLRTLHCTHLHPSINLASVKVCPPPFHSPHSHPNCPALTAPPRPALAAPPCPHRHRSPPSHLPLSPSLRSPPHSSSPFQ